MGCGASQAAQPSISKVEARPQTHSSYDEWKRTNAAKRIAQAMASDDSRVALKALFTSLDSDGDGKLTSVEWATGLTSNKEFMVRHFGECTFEEHEVAFRQLDEDGNGSLSWEEFEQGARKLQP